MPSSASPLFRALRDRRIPAAMAVFVFLIGFAWHMRPAEASVESRLSETESKIAEANQTKGVLSGEIAGLNERIRAYETQVAALRAEEKAVEVKLAAKQAELDRAESEVRSAYRELKAIARRLKFSLNTLRDRLVAIYQAGSTDIADIVFASNDYGDLVEQSEYLRQIQSSDEDLVARVRTLRDRQRELVMRLKTVKERIEKVRDGIAAQEEQLQTARSAVESQQNKLVRARGVRNATLSRIDSRVGHLEGIRADLQAKIQEQVAAASGVSTLPAGPMSAPSAAGLVWPLSGTLSSGFGYRWGRMHEGIDIAVPEGTPIRAAKGGTVIIAAYTGGYGNYTCIDHGSGLSTCYGHQSGYAVSSGQRVSQGQVIGYSGNTGSSTGPHLHFEVRINGAAQDPMGYL